MQTMTEQYEGTLNWDELKRQAEQMRHYLRQSRFIAPLVLGTAVAGLLCWAVNAALGRSDWIWLPAGAAVFLVAIGLPTWVSQSWNAYQTKRRLRVAEASHGDLFAFFKNEAKQALREARQLRVVLLVVGIFLVVSGIVESLRTHVTVSIVIDVLLGAWAIGSAIHNHVVRIPRIQRELSRYS